jgi:hypothetical protein
MAAHGLCLGANKNGGAAPADANGAPCPCKAQTMPALTMVARRPANVAVDKVLELLAGHQAGVQLFFSSASAQALVLVALTIMSVSLRCSGVMPGAP